MGRAFYTGSDGVTVETVHEFIPVREHLTAGPGAQAEAFSDPVAEHYGKWCGKWTLKGRALDRSEVRYSRMHCKCWHCRYCGPRKAGRYKAAIIKAAERHDLTRFLTLTLDPAKVSGDPVKYLRRCFSEFRVYLKRKFGVAPKYIAVVEFHESGLPHLHIIVDRFMEWNWLRRVWETVGGGSHVDIRKVDIHRVSRYLSKYLTKDMFLSAPASHRSRLGSIKFRRVTVARGITLNEKLKAEHRWVKLTDSIRRLFAKHVRAVRDVEVDENNCLVGFAIYADFSRRLHGGISLGSWLDAVAVQ